MTDRYSARRPERGGGREPIFHCLRRNLIRSVLLLLLLLVMLAPVSWAAYGGSTGATFLELGIGARAAAMGQAQTAWAEPHRHADHLR